MVPFYELRPRVEPTDLLIEADGWVGFSRHFVHAGRAPPMPGSTGPTSTQRCCPGPLGITAVADVAELSFRQLDWAPVAIPWLGFAGGHCRYCKSGREMSALPSRARSSVLAARVTRQTAACRDADAAGFCDSFDFARRYPLAERGPWANLSFRRELLVSLGAPALFARVSGAALRLVFAVAALAEALRVERPGVALRRLAPVDRPCAARIARRAYSVTPAALMLTLPWVSRAPHAPRQG